MAYVFYNPNPVGRLVGDCAIRAIAKALDTDWDLMAEAPDDQSRKEIERLVSKMRG